MRERRKGDLINLSVITALSVLYFMDIPVSAYSFHFVHANIFHLCTNLIAIAGIFHYDGKWALMLLSAYISASLSWLINQNAVGFSGIIFFVWGARFFKDWPLMNGAFKKKYAASILISLTVSIVIPSVSAWLHIIPFVSGMTFGGARMLISNYKNDLKRVNKKYI